MRLAVFLCVVLAASAVCAKRYGGGSSSRKGGGSRPSTSNKPRPSPSAPPRADTSNHFLNSERASSTGGGGTTHNRNPMFPSAPQPPKPSSHQTSGPIGFEHLGSGSSQGNHKLGFDNVNSQVQNKPAGSFNPSAPNYPGGNPPHGPPPSYYPGTHSGGIHEPPPAYPGRPVNAPPSYSPTNPHFGQTNTQPGFGNNYQGQGYHGQQNFGNNYQHQNQFGNPGSSYPQQNQFGNMGYGSYPAFGSPSYHGNTGSYPGYSGNSFGNTYQGNSFGGNPFGGTGHNSNPYYSPNNFGYSNNPGYFGSQGGYHGYPGQYDNYQKKSRFGGLPIPIPIPIPIPLGGGGFGGFGGSGEPSYHHRLLNSFIKSKGTNTTSSNSTTSVFILNNSTVTPCTTDHFVYDQVKVTVESCTAELCTGIKVSTITNVANVVTVHSAGLTMCYEQNTTFSSSGDNITPTVSNLQQETLKVCRDVPNNVTAKANATAEGETTTTAPAGTDATTTDVTTTEITTTVEAISTTSASAVKANTTKVCEDVECSWVEMCLTPVEIVDRCETKDCPFRRTGYKPCVTIKMCRSPSAPVSTFATINTTVSKIDEFDHRRSVYDAANLTLISYHRPVINFNCSKNDSSPGCSPPTNTPAQPACRPADSNQAVTDSASSSSGNSSLPLCSTTQSTSSSAPSSEATTATSSPQPSR